MGCIDSYREGMKLSKVTEGAESSSSGKQILNSNKKKSARISKI